MNSASSPAPSVRCSPASRSRAMCACRPAGTASRRFRGFGKSSPSSRSTCTAYSDYSWDDIARTLGESDSVLILKKPFDSVEVLQMAHTLMKKWQLARVAARLSRPFRALRRGRRPEVSPWALFSCPCGTGRGRRRKNIGTRPGTAIVTAQPQRGGTPKPRVKPWVTRR